MEKLSQEGGSAKWLLRLFVAVVLLICPLQDVKGAAPRWTLPSMASVNHTSWAKTQTFTVGDRLFSHMGGQIKVAEEVVAAESGTQHQVGGTPGWSLPSRANVNYTDWARTQTFHVGDTLYFNYSSAFHNVLQVTESKYDKCDNTSSIAKWDDGATIVSLTRTGTFYFICGIPGHCQVGQKVAVPVVGATSNSSSSQTPTMSSPASTSPLPLSTNAVSPLCRLLALSLVSLLVYG